MGDRETAIVAGWGGVFFGTVLIIVGLIAGPACLAFTGAVVNTIAGLVLYSYYGSDAHREHAWRVREGRLAKQNSQDFDEIVRDFHEQ